MVREWPATAEDDKYFKEQLQDLFGHSGQNDGELWDVRSSSDFVIEYGKVLKDTDEEVKNLLERKRDIKTHRQAKTFTNQVTKESEKICAATKDLVCIPDRIDLNILNQHWTCMQCSQVKNDTSFDIKSRSVHVYSICGQTDKRSQRWFWGEQDKSNFSADRARPNWIWSRWKSPGDSHQFILIRPLIHSDFLICHSKIPQTSPNSFSWFIDD